MMTSRELNQKLIDLFPEIKTEIETAMSWQDGLDTGSTILFEDVFVKSVVAAMHSKNIAYVDRAFAFVENMMGIDDEYASNVVKVAFIEAIASYDEREELEKYMPPKTFASYCECKSQF